MRPLLWVVGPAALSEPLVASYRRWGGVAEAFAEVPDAPPPGLLLQLSGAPLMVGPQAVPLALGATAAVRLVLPVVVTHRGVLYAEAIGTAGQMCWQPEPLADAARQVLYRFVRGLLDSRAVLPGVHQFVFAVAADRLLFEQWLPSPDHTALVTLASQSPDLFECHWRAALGLPLVDLQVHRPAACRAFSELSETLLQTAALLAEVQPYAPARALLLQAPTVDAACRQLAALV